MSSRRKTVRLSAILFALALIPASLGAAHATTPEASDSASPWDVVDIPKPASKARVAESAIDYWTPERMAQAQPIEVDYPKLSNSALEKSQALALQRSTSLIVSPTDSTKPSPELGGLGMRMPSALGMIFSKAPNGSNRFCSGAVVNSDNGNLLYTAAHCLYNKNEKLGPDGWHTDIVFAPAAFYTETEWRGEKVLVGHTPVGSWEVEGASVMHGWTEDHDRDYDQAFASLTPNRSGTEIIDVVGGNGLKRSTSQSQSQPITIWGYPVDDPFGEPALHYYACASSITPSNAIADGVKSACWMTGGASGGPWLDNLVDFNRGNIFAVTSGRPEAGQPGDQYMHGVRVNADTETLYHHREAQNAYE